MLTNGPRRASGVLVFAVAAGLLLPGTRAGGQELLLDAAALADLRAAVFPLVERETGVSLEGIPLRTCDTEELRTILVEELAPQFAALGGDAAAARARAEAAAAVYAVALMAKFAVATRVVLVCPENLAKNSRQLDEPLLRTRAGLCAILAHEAAHAADERRFGYSRSLQRLGDAQAQQAFNAVIEGHAQVVARAVCRTAGWTEAFESLRRGIGKQPVVEGADGGTRILARAVAASVAIAYLDGEAFMAELRTRGGDAAVARAFRTPPADLETVCHPEWFLDPASRPPPGFDFDAGLAALEGACGADSWSSTRQSLAPAQLRVGLEPLPAADVDRIVGALRGSRVTVLTPKAAPATRRIVALFAEFASPMESLFYVAAAERLGRIKDAALQEGAVTVAEASYETLHGRGWIGVAASKTIKAGGLSLPTVTLVAASGSRSLELFVSGEATTATRLAEWADRMFAAARATTSPPTPPKPAAP